MDSMELEVNEERAVRGRILCIDSFIDISRKFGTSKC